MKTSALRNWIGCLALPVLLLSGCFQATEKFYLESDIVTDSRFVGMFAPAGDPQTSSLSIEPKGKHYVATFREGEKWIKLDTVLFKSSTNLFADITRIDDNGMPQNPGGGPTRLALLHLATADKTHSAFPVQFSTNEVEFRFAVGNMAALALTREPGMKVKLLNEARVLLLDPTDKLRTFLSKVGSQKALFNQTSKWRKETK